MNRDEEEVTKPELKAAAPDAKLHPPPSMLWFIIPLGLLLLYGVLSR